MSFKKKLLKIDLFIRELNHNRIDFLRLLRVKIFKLFFNQRPQIHNNFPNNLPINLPINLINPTLQKHIQSQQKKSVLILRLDGKLGDSITLSGYLHYLINHGFEVVVLVRPGQEFIYELISKKIKCRPLKKGFFSFLKFFIQHKSTSYEALFVTSHLLDPASLFIGRFFKASKKIVFKNSDLLFFTHSISKNFNSSPIVFRYFQSLEALFPEKWSSELKDLGLNEIKNLLHYKLELPEAQSQRAEKIMKELKNNFSRSIILNAFSGAKTRSLSKEIVKGIIEHITHKTNDIVITIGHGHDLEILKTWKSEVTVPIQKRWFIFDDSNFSFNAALIEKCDLVITPDTSWIHVASLYNIKLIALYRPDLNSEDRSHKSQIGQKLNQEHNQEINSKIWAPLHLGSEKVHILFSKDMNINTIDLNHLFQLILNS